MIRIIDGNLLDSKADVICHQVNCQSAMNSGLAKQIRQKYPEVYNQYKMLCSCGDKTKLLGFCQPVCIAENRFIANLFGQFNYGYDGKQYTNLNALKNSMMCLTSYFDMNKTIAFPYGLGSVRGGAKWEDVYSIIEEVFDGYNVEIWRLDRG